MTKRIIPPVILLVCTFLVRQAAAQQPAGSFTAYSQPLAGTELQFNMVPVKAGSFIMGSSPAEKNRKADEGPAKSIMVSSFWMGATEVTYDQYDAYFKDEAFTRNQPEPDAITRPSPPYIDLTLGMGKQGGFPANSMSQYGALMYCRWLTRKTGIFYRLPTEAEWEYACREGKQTAYPFGDDTTGLGKYAWYKNNSENKYHKTALKAPNTLGLYDMLGNVAEWTLDQYDENYFTQPETAASDPIIKPASRNTRTLKGGNYQDEATQLRSANRLKSSPDWNRRDPQIPRSRWWNADAPFIGFRVVRPAVQPSQAEINKFFSLYLDNY